MIKKLFLKLGFTENDIYEMKIYAKILIAFIIFMCLFTIPWFYGWYKILF